MSNEEQANVPDQPSCSNQDQSATKDSKRKHEELGDDEVVTMLDVLEDEEALEEDAKAVLGNADDKNCSYASNECYKRQALYACITCSVPASPDFLPAAICLACSYQCHPSHEVVELYTKRHFRCDCGTNRLKDNPCVLTPDKSPDNNNTYNQNFRGVYCTCHRPYPDPEDETPDEMIQCILCEDWYHGRHLEGISKPPADNSYSEMICHLCFDKHKDFLAAYKGLAVTQVSGPSTDASIDADAKDDAKDVEVGNTSHANLDESVNTTLQDDPNGSHQVTSSQTGSDSCHLAVYRQTKADTEPAISALFLPAGWREQLCTCTDCKKMYSDKSVSFILDPEDTVHHFESLAKEKNGGSTQYEEGMRALSGMDHVQQVEAIQSYNEMKDELRNYLATFARDGRVVTPDDVKNFFETMKTNKRQRLDMPKFCR